MLTKLFNLFSTSKTDSVKEINYNKYESILEYVPTNNNTISKTYYSSSSLINNISHFCSSQSNKKFIVSLSGGVDSMVLISIIHYLGYKVFGVHINYNNREETKLEQEFLENWCAYNNIKLYTKNIENLKRVNSKRSDYELITKNIRLNFYREIMYKENVETILLGHHKDDIVENIFANVCRGRYILDLAVIKEKSLIDNITIGRPMIDFYKTVIYDFAHKYQIPYFKDTTPDWSVRGKYRNKIYPIIEDAFSKNIKENLIGLSNQSYEWNELVTNKIIEPFINNINFDSNSLEFDIEKHKNYPLCFWNVIFMNLFNKYGYGCPSRKAIQTFISTINKDTIKDSCRSYISISNNCKCVLQNNKIKIEFNISEF